MGLEGEKNPSRWPEGQVEGLAWWQGVAGLLGGGDGLCQGWGPEGVPQG